MKDNQLKWVNDISSAISDARQSERDLQQRSRASGIIADRLLQSDTGDEIREVFGSVMIERSDGKTLPLLDLTSHNPLGEIDTYHDLPGHKQIDPDKIRQLREAMDKIVEVQNELQELEFYKIDYDKAPFVDEDGNPDYDPDLPTHEQQAMIDLKNDRMAKDLWQPMMREGLIPENMIPQKYSEVAITFAGASAAYDERLQEHSKNMSQADIFLEKFAPVKDIGGKVITATGSLTSFVGTAGDLAGNSTVVKDAAEAAEIIKMIDVAFTATCDIVPLVVKERDGIKVMDVFNDALKSVLEGAGVDTGTAGLIHGVINGATRSAATGKALAEGDFESAFDEFGKAIGASFGATGDESLQEIGNQISFAVARMGTAAKVTKALNKNPPEPGTAIQLMLGDVSLFVKSPEIKLVLKILADGAGAVQTAAQERDVFKITDFIGSLVATSLEQAGVDKDVAYAVNNSISSAIAGAKIGRALAQDNPEEAFATLGSAINASLTGTGNADLGEIGTIIESTITTTTSATNFVRAVRDGDISGATSALNNAIQSALGGSGFLGAAENLKGDPRDEDSPLNQMLAKIEEVAESEALAAANELAEIRIEKDQPITSEQLEALEAAKAAQEERAARSEEERLRAFMEEDDAAFNEMLMTGFGPIEGSAQEIARAEERRLASIENMIAIVQRDKKTFELAQKICTKGPQLLADLVPGAGLAAACAEMAFKIAEAVKHAEQLIIWTQNMEDAHAAATVQLDAMMNRYGLEKKHVLRARIEVGIQAVKIAGEATKLSPAAPIGLLISSGASGASATFAVAWAAQDYGEFRKAWTTYKKAIENPEDRKAARKAMRSNATLSKYAMAYGALHDGNAIAREAMRRCNITEATLVQPETNVDKLVEYLETLYSDDPVIVKAVPVKNDWYPGEVELSYSSFSRFFYKATQDANPKLGNNDVTAIKGALSDADMSFLEFNRLRSIAEPGAAIPLEAETAALEDTKRLKNALKAYSPKDEQGAVHAEMAKYVETLTAMTMLRWRSLQKAAKAEQAKRAVSTEEETEMAA